MYTFITLNLPFVSFSFNSTPNQLGDLMLYTKNNWSFLQKIPNPPEAPLKFYPIPSLRFQKHLDIFISSYFSIFVSCNSKVASCSFFTIYLTERDLEGPPKCLIFYEKIFIICGLKLILKHPPLFLMFLFVQLIWECKRSGVDSLASYFSLLLLL